MQFTKSQFVLGITEDLLEQDDLALVEKIQREYGIDLLSEEEFSDDDLVEATGGLFDPHHLNAVSSAVGGAAGSVASGVLHPIGHAVAGGLIGTGVPGLHHLGTLAASSPVAAGAAALGLGAAAALRMRKNARVRAQARAAGMR